jgi:DNA-binding MarR family transcriptional regulator
VTPQGQIQYQEALQARRTHLAELLSRLSDDERTDLVRALKPLERLTEAED